MSIGKVPPHNLEMERAVIGAILLDNEALNRCMDVLSGESDFYKPAHAKIYQVMVELYNRAQPIDLMTLSEGLKSRGWLKQIGDVDYLAELVDLMPTAANVSIHAKTVLQKAIQRRIISTAGEVLNLAYQDHDDFDQLIDDVEHKVLATTNGVNKKGVGLKRIDSLIKSATTELELYSTDKDAFIKTGLVDLDRTLYGFLPGEMVILCGRPAMGKTAVALNIALDVALKGKKVGVFSLEMGNNSIVRRFAGARSKTSYQSMDAKSKDLWKAWIDVCVDLKRLPIFIDDMSAPKPLDIKRAIRKQPVDLVIIDYLQLMTPPRNQGNKVVETSEISKAIKEMARDMDIPVILLSQLSREVEKRDDKRPRLSDLSWSGQIEQDADKIVSVYRPYYYTENESDRTVMELGVIKHRNGPTGKAEIYFNPETMECGNLAKEGLL